MINAYDVPYDYESIMHYGQTVSTSLPDCRRKRGVEDVDECLSSFTHRLSQPTEGGPLKHWIPSTKMWSDKATASAFMTSNWSTWCTAATVSVAWKIAYLSVILYAFYSTSKTTEKAVCTKLRDVKWAQLEIGTINNRYARSINTSTMDPRKELSTDPTLLYICRFLAMRCLNSWEVSCRPCSRMTMINDKLIESKDCFKINRSKKQLWDANTGITFYTSLELP